MAKFAIILAALVAFANIQPNVAKYFDNDEHGTNDDSLLFMILDAKNRAFEQVQHIKVSAAVHTDEFIERVNKVVEKAWIDIDLIKIKSNNANDAICDNVKDAINNNALKTIEHYESCVSKVIGNAEWHMQSIVSDASTLTKEIQAAQIIDEELYNKVAELNASSLQFDRYASQLKKCNTNSNLTRLNRQIAEALVSYTQCLQTK